MGPIVVMDLIVIGFAVLLFLADKFLAQYSECVVTINREKILKGSGNQSLLELLTENKIYIPSACGGKATCGHCKVRILSGAGEVLPTEEVFLNTEERNRGIRLACQVKLRGPIEILVPEYLFSTEEFYSRVDDIKDLTYDIKFLRLKIIGSKRIRFKPGQYIQIWIPGTNEYRAYSIASSPSMDDAIELIIRLVPGGLCSTYVHKVLERGDTVKFIGPFGDFYLREENNREIIAIGGGCGMAPIRSIILYLIEKGMPRKFTYFFGARAKRDLYFTEELNEISLRYPNFSYIPALSEPLPEDNWPGEVGLITQVAEKYLIQDGSEKEAYLCGPGPMIEAALKALPQKGIKSEYIYYDKF